MRSSLIYIFYIIFLISITAFLSIQMIMGKIGLKAKAIEPIRKIIVEHKLISYIKTLEEAEKGCVNEKLSNYLGFLDNEWELNKPPNTFRIIALGDSFTEDRCVHYNETWPKQLEKKLNNLNLSLKFEVFNMGRGGINIFQKVEILKRIGLPFHPDMIILQYFWDDYISSSEVGKKGRELWIKYKKGELSFSPSFERAIHNAPEEIVSRIFYGITLDEYLTTANLDEEFNKWTKIPLLELINITKKMKIKLLVILIPDLSGGKPPSYDDEVIRILQEYGIDFYDFSELLSKFPLHTILRKDGHLKSLGYEIVANHTANLIVKILEGQER